MENNLLVLPLSFYRTNDTVDIAKKLLGKYIFTKFDGILTGGMIVETESYLGIEDKGSHAFNGRFTSRTEPLYESGGIAYVYLCYGMHYMFNVVTNTKKVPHAVLIRAIEPTTGIELMLKRRGMKKISPSLTAGPGALCKALNITKEQNKQSLKSSTLWIEDRKIYFSENEIMKSQRVGISYAKEWALFPFRFRIKGNKWTSKAK